MPPSAVYVGFSIQGDIAWTWVWFFVDLTLFVEWMVAFCGVLLLDAVANCCRIQPGHPLLGLLGSFTSTSILMQMVLETTRFLNIDNLDAHNAILQTVFFFAALASVLIFHKDSKKKQAQLQSSGSEELTEEAEQPRRTAHITNVQMGGNAVALAGLLTLIPFHGLRLMAHYWFPKSENSSDDFYFATNDSNDQIRCGMYVFLLAGWVSSCICWITAANLEPSRFQCFYKWFAVMGKRAAQPARVDATDSESSDHPADNM